ncbi:hypothetical protein N781_16850 [Pontibacillus halophilus JSM 076056 = DSM 19796]|uniref:Uncharacterized protein n=1 Tax=Pontibacillus halophilus JSM 076056 = DSM 19796 TaxID=1385510 RepID=A0A0A5GKN8_9BACI|nr:hypothetical protein [Pontibacillus halophilus]KGX92509.1 hypothetical protein N781_16850 [Pontibacillus halophilus JSM 076056 = DSM 19796]
MSFWTWLAISIASINGIAIANAEKKKAERKHAVTLVWIIIAVILLFVWWFSR